MPLILNISIPAPTYAIISCVCVCVCVCIYIYIYIYINKDNYLFLSLHFTLKTLLCATSVLTQVIYVYHSFFTLGLTNNTVNCSDYRVSNITRINDKQSETCVEGSTHKPTLQHLMPPPTK